MTVATPIPGTFLYREPALIVQDLIQQSMGLTDAQVIFSNEKIFIPTIGPLVVVRYIGPSKIICSVDEFDSVNNVEVQSLTMAHRLQIDIMSYDTTARLRKDEIAFAINSILSESQQELYNMYIAKFTGAFMDTSFLEETKRVYCFTTDLATISVNQKTQPTGDYYQDFSKAVPPQVVVNA